MTDSQQREYNEHMSKYIFYRDNAKTLPEDSFERMAMEGCAISRLQMAQDIERSIPMRTGKGTNYTREFIDQVHQMD